MASQRQKRGPPDSISDLAGKDKKPKVSTPANNDDAAASDSTPCAIKSTAVKCLSKFKANDTELDIKTKELRGIIARGDANVSIVLEEYYKLSVAANKHNVGVKVLLQEFPELGEAISSPYSAFRESFKELHEEVMNFNPVTRNEHEKTEASPKLPSTDVKFPKHKTTMADLVVVADSNSLQQEVESLNQLNESLKKENEVLKQQNEPVDSLKQENESLKKKNEALKQEVMVSKESQSSLEGTKTGAIQNSANTTTKMLENIENRIQRLEKQHESTLDAQKPNHFTFNRNDYESYMIYSSNFVDHLKSIDFRPPNGIWDWINKTFSLAVYDLWTNGSFKYRLRLNTPKPRCATRHQRGYPYDYSGRDNFEPRCFSMYSQAIMELEMQEKLPKEISVTLPKYVLHIGDLHVLQSSTKDSRPPNETSANNLCLVMDVTKPSKSLWLVYKYELPKSGQNNDVEFYPDKKVFPNVQTEFDIALILHHIHGWKAPNEKISQPYLDSERVDDLMQRTACRAHPVFTKPKVDELLKSIENGWAGYGSH